jgi:hypothetical protein
MSFVFNLQTVSTARRRCRSFQSRHDVIDCGHGRAQDFTNRYSKFKKYKKVRKISKKTSV